MPARGTTGGPLLSGSTVAARTSGTSSQGGGGRAATAAAPLLTGASAAHTPVGAPGGVPRVGLGIPGRGGSRKRAPRSRAPIISNGLPRPGKRAAQVAQRPAPARAVVVPRAGQAVARPAPARAARPVSSPTLRIPPARAVVVSVPAATTAPRRPGRRGTGFAADGRVVSKRQQRWLFARKDPRAHELARRGAEYDRLPSRASRRPRTAR
jgi:hypothetical protein